MNNTAKDGNSGQKFQTGDAEGTESRIEEVSEIMFK